MPPAISLLEQKVHLVQSRTQQYLVVSPLSYPPYSLLLPLVQALVIFSWKAFYGKTQVPKLMPLGAAFYQWQTRSLVDENPSSSVHTTSYIMIKPQLPIVQPAHESTLQWLPFPPCFTSSVPYWWFWGHHSNKLIALKSCLGFCFWETPTMTLWFVGEGLAAGGAAAWWAGVWPLKSGV